MTTATLPTPTAEQLLDDELLARFDERAPVYDRENRFFTEDLDELRERGYLNVAVPVSFGGLGLRIDDVLRLQERLAYVAAPTAIAVNMHLYWTGVARDLQGWGDDSMAWVLRESVAGKVFAAGHGEAGNDLPLAYSTSRAVRVGGGWEISGHKIFGSLSPAWDYLGFHAADTSEPDNPRIVHGFLPRSAEGYRIVETWDTLGMRATQSHDTILDGVRVDDQHVVLVCPAGMAGGGAFAGALFAWAGFGFAAVYLGAARRAYDLVTSRMHERTSVALTRSMAHHPEVQHTVAEMRIALETASALLYVNARDWADGVDHGADWGPKILATKHEVVRRAFEVVDKALDLSGGAGVFKRSRLEQLFRDVRLGRVHPPNDALAHELIGKMSLGIDPDSRPRWG